MGTKTLLNGVNDVLKRMGHIKGNSGELTSLVDSQRQVLIDLSVQCWNETLLDLYDSSNEMLPNEMGITTITLVTGDRDYTLPTGLVSVRWPLKNDTNGDLIVEYQGGYLGMFQDQLQSANYTGKPYAACIRPSDGQLYLDRIPTSAENGAVYTLLYDKSITLTDDTDTFSFIDDVYTALLPAVVEKVKMERDEQSDARYAVSIRKYEKALGRAAALLPMKVMKSTYGLARFSGHSSDPLEV